MALLSMAREWDQVAERSIRSWIEQNHKHTVRVFYRDQGEMLTRLLKRTMDKTAVTDLGGEITYWEF